MRRLPTVRIEVEVNGERHRLEVDPARRLASVLRDDLGLTGTKLGCGEGACGSCAVLLDGVPVNSCLVLAGSVEGRSVVTIEGLSAQGLTPLQRAFVEEDGLQCGFCTPGQIISATALLAANPSPTREQIRTAMSGNICRCGAYPKIELAVLRAAREAA
jgi:aerobic-type carbon monoxide dehydrogenase small subunit (CoxS/CutS family)